MMCFIVCTYGGGETRNRNELNISGNTNDDHNNKSVINNDDDNNNK
jgi:hypothetical protein